VDRDATLPALQERLAAPAAATRGSAALALGFTRQPAALDPLLVALATERDLAVTQRVIQALGELGLPAAGPGLRRAAAEDPRVQADVAAALARLAAPAP
jgi:HEAT repeat protein